MRFYPRKSRRSNPIESLFFWWQDGLSFYGKWTLSMSFGLWLYSWNHPHFWVKMSAYTGLIGVVIAVIFAKIWPYSSSAQLRRRAPSFVYEGQSFTLEWQEINPHQSHRSWQEKILPDGLLLQKPQFEDPDSLTRIQAIRPGFYEFEGPLLIMDDWMGIARSRRKWHNPNPKEGIWVWPQGPKIKSFRKLLGKGLMLSSPWAFQNEMQWQSLRPFQSGDRLKDIDPRSSAKHQKWLSRVYETVQPEQKLYWVIIETLKPQWSRPWVLHAQIKWASSLCHLLAQHHCLGGLVLYDKAFVNHDPSDSKFCLNHLALTSLGFGHMRTQKTTVEWSQEIQAQILKEIPLSQINDQAALVLGEHPSSNPHPHWIYLGPSESRNGIYLQWEQAWDKDIDL